MGGKGSGAKRTLKDKKCKSCGVVFRPHTITVMFCGNKCRLKHLHEGRRKEGRFFDVVCWTAEEDAIINRMYPNPENSVSAISEIMPGRTKRAIRNRTIDLGVKRTHRIGLVGEKNHFYGKKHTEETKARISEIVKVNTCFHEKNKDPEFQKKRRVAWAKSVKASPNKLETWLHELIECACPGDYEYVGGGDFLIDGLNPDWVCRSKKKTIELFGRFFHDPDFCKWEVEERRTEKGRRKVFKDHGYRLLVLWDDDLKRWDDKDVIDVIKRFTEIKGEQDK